MSVYYDNLICGIGWNIFKNDEIIKTYEKHYNDKMTTENVRKVEEEYYKLTNYEKENTKFFIITNGITKYNVNPSNIFVRYYLNQNKIEEIFIINKLKSIKRESSQRSNSLSERINIKK